MTKAEWDRFPPETEQLPPGEIPTKYTLPFSWGSFKVSEAAHAAYGLVPLTANKISGNAETRASIIPQIEAWLVTPEEADWSVQAPYEELTDFGMQMATVIHKDGLRLVASFTKPVDTVKEGALASIKSELGLDDDADLDEVRDSMGIPASESMDRLFPHVYSHLLWTSIAEQTQEPLAEWYRAAENRKNWKRLQVIGAYAVGASALVGFNTSNAINHPTTLTETEAGVIAAFTVIGLVSVRSIVKHVLGSSGRRELGIRESAALMAGLAASDLHETYCTIHFDTQAERLFENSPDE